eukprot:12921515-Prorocentrum_lima.AAC.1
MAAWRRSPNALATSVRGKGKTVGAVLSSRLSSVSTNVPGPASLCNPMSSFIMSLHSCRWCRSDRSLPGDGVTCDCVGVAVAHVLLASG